MGKWSQAHTNRPFSALHIFKRNNRSNHFVLDFVKPENALVYMNKLVMPIRLVGEMVYYDYAYDKIISFANIEEI